MMGGAVYGFRALARERSARRRASKLAGAIRYCFDRAVTTGAYYRIVLDLDGNKYWAERSDDRMYLTRDKEDVARQGQGASTRRREREEARRGGRKRQRSWRRRGGAARRSSRRPSRGARKFQTFKDATLPQVTLKRARIFDIYTPRQREPYTAGRAYLYFFPDGHTERAVVRLTDGDDFYSLVVHPLTGRVEVRAGKYDIPRDFDERDERASEVPR